MKLYKLVNYNIKNNHIANNSPTKELLLNLETESKELIDANYDRFIENLAKPIFDKWFIYYTEYCFISKKRG